MRAWWAIILLLAAAPVAGEPAPADGPAVAATVNELYIHLDGFAQAPMSLVAPPADRTHDVRMGLATHSTSCLPDMPGAPFTGRAWHTVDARPANGPVEYTPDGLHYDPTPGGGFDLVLMEDQPPVLHWFLSADWSHGTLAPADGLPVPEVVVQATMLTGVPNDPSYNSGAVIAMGQSEAVTLSPLAEGHERVGERDVYAFEVPLELESTAIPRGPLFLLRIDAWMENPLCSGDGYLMPNSVAFHTSEGHRPRLEVPNQQPLRVGSVHPQLWENDTLVVHATFESPWGQYAIRNATATLQGPDGPLLIPFVGESGRYHCHCYPPPPRTFSWALDLEAVPPGDHEIHVHAEGIQGETTEATLPFPRTDRAEAPGLALGALAGALLLGSLSRRRRG